MHKNYRYSYFYHRKSDNVFRFSVKLSNFRKNRIKVRISGNFLIKEIEKVIREKTYLLKLELYNTDRKMKSTIRCILISIIMHPNFTCFHKKISFKSALEMFTPVSGHLRTALNLSYSFKFKSAFGDQKWDISLFSAPCLFLNQGNTLQHSYKNKICF